MSTLIQDLRYAIRTLGKSPGFTAVAVISLALGIGANSSIFSVINATLWRELPYAEPERLVMVERASPDPKFPISLWSYPKYEMLRDQSQVFESLAAFSNQDFPITGSDSPERVEVEAVSASYFPLLGLSASRGRVFTPEEDLKPGAHAVALISHELYRSRFNSDPNIVGQPIELNKVAFTIVGILPEGFAGQSGKAEAWVPMMMMPSLTFPRRLASAGAHWHKVLARLKPGVTREQAQAEVAVIGNNIQEAISKKFSPEPETLSVVGLKESKIDQGIARSFLILFAAVGFVLLIACVNIANLLMARSAARQKEMAIRMAVGASRLRLIRQLLTESVLLATIGGAVGLLVALWGIESLTVIKPASILSLQELDFGNARIDSRVLGFNLALSIFTGLLFGLMPALQSARSEVSELLKDGAIGQRETRGWVRRLSPRNLLVVAEIALAMVLLIGAGLMIRSFARLQAIETGFDPANTLTVKAELPKYKRDAAAAFYEMLLGRVKSLPGVESASVASSTPLSSNSGGTLLTIEGRPPLDSPGVQLHSVGPDYFKTLRVPLVAGRVFTEQDRAGATRVAVINQKAAETYFPGEDPIGKRINLAVGWEPETDRAEIVGVVGNVKYGQVEGAVKPDFYLSYLQPTEDSSFLLVRTTNDPASLAPAIRKEVLALDKNVPLYDIKTLEERASAATSRTRFSAFVLGVFAALAMMLAGVGIYGVMAFSVAGRTREIGIRIALGAKSSDVLRLVMSEGLVMTVAGVAIGLAAAWATTHILASQLYGVSSTDLSTFAGISLMLAAVALAACYVPARRATKVDPMVALRYE